MHYLTWVFLKYFVHDCSPPIQMESWARCLRDSISFPFQRKLYILAFFFFFLYLRIVYIWIMYYSLDKKIFTAQRESDSVLDVDFLIIPSITFSQFVLSRIELPILTPSILMENCGQCICPGWSALILYAPSHELGSWSLSLR